MGKYMKKSKMMSDIALMEVVSLSPQCTLGVRTRAKTLALQRQLENQKPRSLVDESSFAYLELRSRRLEKPPLLLGDSKKRGGHRSWPAAEDLCGESGNPSPNVSWSNSRFRVRSMESVNSVALEASLGENDVDFEARDRSTRESTPCSLIRELDTLTPPGSTTRRAGSTASNQKVRNDLRRNIPTAHELEEFFAIAEQQQQRIFIDKYNFDFVNESPLSGRYEWVQAMP